MSTAVAEKQKPKGELAPAENAFVTLRTMLEKTSDRLRAVAPKYLSVDRLLRLLLSACSRNPDILKCSQNSVLQFAMKCAETGLEPIGAGGAWPIAFKNKKVNPPVYELTFIPDYRGLINCAKRANCITHAYAHVVKQKDEFDFSLGVNPTLDHKPARGDRGELEAAYCVYILPDGTRDFVVMDKQEIEHIRNTRSAGWKANQTTPWTTDAAEMWKKTVIRRAMKPFAGMSKELDAAVEALDESDPVDLEPVPMPKAIDETKQPAAPAESNGDHGGANGQSTDLRDQMCNDIDDKLNDCASMEDVIAIRALIDANDELLGQTATIPRRDRLDQLQKKFGQGAKGKKSK